ncbi:hypothetical protein [Streptomyces olivaceus]|uniref:hypothetical protein n=1 Tax=Streptomyces olivaceus TaxID=47716 RepID=UPI001CC8F176|nr:hypothetical protein [Streptomyces olivaceus]MBZ6227126.1 hypothetical protein [Streptomyces olivaceus]
MPLTAAARPLTSVPRGARHRSRLVEPVSPEADVLRVVADARTPVFVTVRQDGRRRYSYWRPLDSVTGRGGCYAALPTAVCDALHAAGRITLGEPIADPDRTTYRVGVVRTPPTPVSELPRQVRGRREQAMSRAA